MSAEPGEQSPQAQIVTACRVLEKAGQSDMVWGHVSMRDPNGRAYNRTSHLPERRRMMQQWADYLDELKAGVEVVPPYRLAS